MSHNSTFKDIIHVTFSNIISLTSSILNGFVTPVILGTLDYGYYKIFTLYASYTFLFHFGFNDGILLSYGGKDYNRLDKYKFRPNSVFFIEFQFVVALLIIMMSFFTHDYFYKILFLLLGVNDFSQNLLNYYQNISQTFMKFTEYSIINTFQYIFFIISVMGILIYCKVFHNRISFIPYIIIIISINTILAIWYLYYYKKITFGKHPPILSNYKKFGKYFITGAYLTFGYGVSILIFNLDSQFVVHFFSTRTYGIYGFAYSMFSAGLTILGAAAVVLLPHLKTHSVKYIIDRYNNNITYVLLLVYLAIAGYFPLKIIVYKFINQYINSLIYFRMLLPGMVITCCVSIVISNYYYALKKSKFYFYLSLIVLFISFIFDSIFYLIFKSPEALALSSTLSLLAWYVLSNYFITKWYKLKWVKNLSYIVIMMILFFIVSSLPNTIIGLLIYLLMYTSISFVLYKQMLFKLIKKLISFV